MFDGQNKLMMSDSLKGLVPDLEEDVLKNFEDTIIIVSLLLSLDDSEDILSGVLVGCSNETEIVKVDFRLDTFQAYGWFAQFGTKNYVCNRLSLMYAEEIHEILGPFRLKCPKISDIDRQTKMSTFGIDLVRI